MTSTKLLFAALALAALISTSAWADWTGWQEPTDLTWFPQTGTGAVSFEKFGDHPTATLIGVEWEYWTYVADGGTLTNTNKTAQDVFYAFYDKVVVKDGLGATLASKYPNYSFGTVSVPAEDSWGGYAESTPVGANGTWTDAPRLAYFDGNGSANGFLFDATFVRQLTTPLPAGVTFDFSEGLTGVGARLRYEYEGSIPEPGTLALVGFGLLGLAAVARRRRTAK